VTNSAVIYRSPHGVDIPDSLQASLDLLLGVVDLPPKLYHGPIPIRRGPVRIPSRPIIIDERAKEKEKENAHD